MRVRHIAVIGLLFRTTPPPTLSLNWVATCKPPRAAPPTRTAAAWMATGAAAASGGGHAASGATPAAVGAVVTAARSVAAPQLEPAGQPLAPGRGMADPPEDAAGHQALADVPWALDIPEDQVAIWSTGDSGRTWFHMVLVHQLETYGARWLGFTSDFRPQLVDLGAVRSVLLIRAGPIPSRLRGNWLGIADVTADELTVARRRCRALAALYGTSIGIPCCSRPTPPIRPAPR